MKKFLLLIGLSIFLPLVSAQSVTVDIDDNFFIIIIGILLMAYFVHLGIKNQDNRYVFFLSIAGFLLVLITSAIQTTILGNNLFEYTGLITLIIYLGYLLGILATFTGFFKFFVNSVKE